MDFRTNNTNRQVDQITSGTSSVGIWFSSMPVMKIKTHWIIFAYWVANTNIISNLIHDFYSPLRWD